MSDPKPVPYQPKGITPFHFQNQGAHRLGSNWNAMLGDEPGLGKTLQAIMACDLVGARTILVLCPSIGKAHWRSKFMAHQTTPRPVHMLNTRTQPVPQSVATGNAVVIANFDLVAQDGLALSSLKRAAWDVVIIDEAHALKTRTAQRTKAIYGKKTDRVGSITEKARYVWPMSGTFAPNHAGELWTHLHALFPDLIKTRAGRPLTEDEFVDLFCETRVKTFGRQIIGSRNLDHLKPILHRAMLRRRKRDVLPDLPPLTFDALVVNPHDASLTPETLDLLRASDKKLLKEVPEFDEFDITTSLRALRNNEHISVQRRLVGQIKADIVAPLILEHLATTKRKIIVFAYHHEVIDKIMLRLAQANVKAVKIDGRTPQGSRDFAEKAFMEDPDTMVFVGQITAAGTTLTLTAASDVLFVEASWVPVENFQAACRAHRIGQHDGVLARFLALEGTLDHHIMAAYVRKSMELADLMNDETPPVIAATGTDVGTLDDFIAPVVKNAKTGGAKPRGNDRSKSPFSTVP